jgi:hypothetical protein
MEAQRLRRGGPGGTPKKLREPGRRFLFHLALALGKSLEEVRELPASEVEEWRIFNEFEPLPDVFWAAAMVCQTIVAVNRAKATKVPTLEEFLPWLKSNRRQTPEEMQAAFRAATAHLGGK